MLGRSVSARRWARSSRLIDQTFSSTHPQATLGNSLNNGVSLPQRRLLDPGLEPVDVMPGPNDVLAGRASFRSGPTGGFQLDLQRRCHPWLF